MYPRIGHAKRVPRASEYGTRAASRTCTTLFGHSARGRQRISVLSSSGDSCRCLVRASLSVIDKRVRCGVEACTARRSSSLTRKREPAESSLGLARPVCLRVCPPACVRAWHAWVCGGAGGEWHCDATSYFLLALPGAICRSGPTLHLLVPAGLSLEACDRPPIFHGCV